MQQADQGTVHAEVRAREAVVGEVGLGQRVVGQLPVVGGDRRVPTAPASVEADLAEGRVLRQAVQAAAEVFEIARIADPVDVGARLPVAGDVLERGVAEHAPIAAAQVVVGHVGAFQRALAALHQVAELRAELEAARGHDPRRQGGIVVRCQVQVDRLPPVETVAAGIGDRGEQQAGAPAFVGGEHEPGHVQHRDLADPQGGAACDREALVRVDVDLARAQLPLALVRRAGRIRGALEAALVAHQGHAVRAAIAPPVQ